MSNTGYTGEDRCYNYQERWKEVFYVTGRKIQKGCIFFFLFYYIVLPVTPVGMMEALFLVVSLRPLVAQVF